MFVLKWLKVLQLLVEHGRNDTPYTQHKGEHAMVQVFIAIGSLDYGFTFFGPFDGSDHAYEWIEASEYDEEECEIITLQAPAEIE